MTPPPLVSVVVPCHELGSYLDAAVESALAQSHQPVEVLVVDDGSTDPGTIRVLDGMERPGVKVLRLPHRGLAATRNAGIEAASGRYLCALDADDLLHPRYLEKAVVLLERDPALTFVSCWLRVFGDESWEWIQDRCDLPALLAECTVCTAAVVRREAVLEAGGYDGGMPAQGNEDWDLWITLLERGGRGAIIPEPLFSYRRRRGSMFDQCATGQAHLENWRHLLRKHEPSYRRHAVEVLLARDEALGDLLRENAALERELADELGPAAARLRGEVARMKARHERGTSMEPAMARIADLERRLAVAQGEVEALRRSLSWKVTGPLRAAYDLVRGRGGGGGGGKVGT